MGSNKIGIVSKLKRYNFVRHFLILLSLLALKFKNLKIFLVNYEKLYGLQN